MKLAPYIEAEMEPYCHNPIKMLYAHKMVLCHNIGKAMLEWLGYGTKIWVPISKSVKQSKFKDSVQPDYQFKNYSPVIPSPIKLFFNSF